MARLRELSQSIYVMEAPTGETKIGIAEDARVRWSSLRYAFPRGELKLLFVSDRSPHMWAVEASIHCLLSGKRLNGEWFDIPAAEAIEIVKAAIAVGAASHLPKPPPPRPPRKVKLVPKGPDLRKIRDPRMIERDAIIAARIAAGEDGSLVAADYGMSHQNVSLIARAAGVKRIRGTKPTCDSSVNPRA